MPQDRALWEVRVGVYATEEQAEDLRERIHLSLCPDPEHRSPCPIPWTTRLADAEALAEAGTDYSHLVEQHLIETLSAQIRDGELPAGRAIPSQSHLMREYGLSRDRVRKAITALQEAGLVEPVRGRGTFVR